MKAKELLISIKPEHLVNILNGKKTLELRKTVPKHYKGWVNIYCTKSKKHFRVLSLGFYEDVLYKLPNGQIKFGFPYEDEKKIFLNGKVVARFWFGEYDTIENEMFLLPDVENIKQLFIEKIYEKACLTIKELVDYSNSKTLYAWHIEELEIFDKPKELSEFYKANLYTPYEVIRAYEETTNDLISYRLQRPPQSYQFVYAKEELK